MRVVRGLDKLQEEPQSTVVTIGNFDGVHRAHQELLRHVVETAHSSVAIATTITFDPHPARVLHPERAPALLTSLEGRIRLIEQQGIDLLIILPFNKDLAQLSPAEFVRRVLVEKLHVAMVCIGPNFRFGYRQAGDIKTLTELGKEEDFEVEVIPALEVRGEQVSSSRVRELVGTGQVHIACRLLGRPFSVTGPTIHGQRIGHQQTVPTVNMALTEGMLPKVGVYITRTRLGSAVHESVTNIGYKPTFGVHQLGIETHLLRFTGEVGQKEAEVEFLYRLRDEQKFENPTLLKAQIEKDIRWALKFFRLVKFSQPPHARYPVRSPT